MITGENKMSDYVEAKKYVDVSVGESVKIIRELQGLSQNKLAELTGIPQSTISAIEHDVTNIGVERAKVLAKALKCHPAVLVFPAPLHFGKPKGTHEKQLKKYHLPCKDFS
jgi:transcriptional regulator with XRE-family HTH domain